MSSTTDSANSAARLLNLLITSGLTLSVAESLTGGLLTARLTKFPGASAVIAGGVVAYSSDVKETLLHVSPESIAQGVVSDAVASQMALGVRVLLKSDISVACTGVAGPGSHDGIPQGTVWIAGASKHLQATKLLKIDGDRDQVREETVDHMIDFVSNNFFPHLSDK
jgi:PncC family amidohydrolase